MKIQYLFFLFLTLLWGCKNKQEKTQAKMEFISESVYASGIIKTQNQYQVFPTVNGLIQRVVVNEGDIVKRGDILLYISNETSILNTENARLASQFSDARAQQDKLKELKLAIDLAKSKMANDSLLAVRQRNLWSKNVGSQFELEQRELAYKNSTSAYRSAILRYQDTERQINFTSQQSKKNLEISNTIAKDYIVRSKINGKIYNVLKKTGELVNPQIPLAVIGSADSFLIELQVDEYDIARITLGQQVLLSLDSYKGKVFEAKVSKIIPIMNERTKSFTIEAQFITSPPKLYPNLTTEANIVIHTKEKALTIPRNYLVDDNFVLLENGEKKAITTGLKDYQKVEVLDGITAKDYLLKPSK